MRDSPCWILGSVQLRNKGGCQNYGPFLGTLNIRCRIIIGIQKRDHNFDITTHKSLGFALFTNNIMHDPE